jgi:ribosome-associated translation inhibitor RaiA
MNFMEILVSSINFKTDTSLENYVREKVGKLFNHSKTIIKANVVLREGEKGIVDNKQCEIRLMVRGYDHFVKKTTDAYEKSVLQAVKVLLKILRRNKNRIIAKRYSNSLIVENKASQ